MKKVAYLLIYSCICIKLFGQAEIKESTITFNDFKSEEANSYFNQKVKNTQFIMIGEQHGIKEVGEITSITFDKVKSDGYNTLCIETSPIAASIMTSMFSEGKSVLEQLTKLFNEYPFSIPFYNNKNDVNLFNNVIKNKGAIIGIDQVFMTEFRLVFDHLINTSNNKKLIAKLKPLVYQAKEGYNKAINDKDMYAPFIFKYSNELHQNLLKIVTSDREKEILHNLKVTRDIYQYNFKNQIYKNNNERAKLMRNNFLNFYKELMKTENTPKILFKLGANHVSKGLNSTNVFDVSSLVSELAYINNKKSLHIYCMGVSGTKYIGNPFAPTSTIPFDNSKNLPKELLEIINNTKNKYIVVDTEKLRDIASLLTSDMKNLVLKYDVLLYIKNTKALEGLN